jgi:large subunit ribosomal protein L22
MEIKVKLNNFRVAPRKARRAVDLIRKKTAKEAVSILSFTVNKSAKPLLKLLNSAIAAAKHNFQIDESNLFVSEVTANEGPKLKRWHPMSRGRAYPIEKRTSHITLILSEIKPKIKKQHVT